MKNMPASAVVAIPTALEASRALAVNKEEALARQEASLLRSLPVNWAGMAVSKEVLEISKAALVASRVDLVVFLASVDSKKKKKKKKKKDSVASRVSKVDLVASRVSKVDMVASRVSKV